METRDTPLGTLIIDEPPALFGRLADAIKELARGDNTTASVGLTGGSTPKAWYRWAAENGVFSPKAQRPIIWAASDERRVPLEDEASNFGNAWRLMLGPLGFPEDKFFPWPQEFDPPAGAIAFESQWTTRFGPDRAFDLCLLGMGDDCHTASIFPGSPLLLTPKPTRFTAVEVPDKGWRFTLTPHGLSCCGRILLVVTGAGKREALATALSGEAREADAPVTLLGRMKDRVTILADPAAAGRVI